MTDGDVIDNLFQVITTPGHTPGHVAYYYPVQQTLFAGDAVAVVGQQACLMARAVTPDLAAARQSALKCLNFDIAYLCPGHRHPLSQDIHKSCQQLKKYLEEDQPWPWLGVMD